MDPPKYKNRLEKSRDPVIKKNTTQNETAICFSSEEKSSSYQKIKQAQKQQKQQKQTKQPKQKKPKKPQMGYSRPQSLNHESDYKQQFLAGSLSNPHNMNNHCLQFEERMNQLIDNARTQMPQLSGIETNSNSQQSLFEIGSQQ